MQKGRFSRAYFYVVASAALVSVTCIAWPTLFPWEFPGRGSRPATECVPPASAAKTTPSLFHVCGPDPFEPSSFSFDSRWAWSKRWSAVRAPPSGLQGNKRPQQCSCVACQPLVLRRIPLVALGPIPNGKRVRSGSESRPRQPRWRRRKYNCLAAPSAHPESQAVTPAELNVLAFF